MGWVKVSLVHDDGIINHETVLSVRYIASYNALTQEFLNDGNNRVFEGCICVSMADVPGANGDVCIKCPSVDEFTRWVRRAEQDGYFNSAQITDVESED